MKPVKSVFIKKYSELDLYIIAFNNADLVFNQIFFLKKNLKDNYRLIIIDNSNNYSKSQEIENICIKNKTSYVKLPENKLKSSYSHALSLNYTMKNIISKQKTKYIGFLDHDCFMIKPISIIKILKEQKLYGTLMDTVSLNIFGHTFNMSGKRWIIWPGCAFYDKELFHRGFNFFPDKQIIPISFLDTGGGNRKYIYKNYEKGKLNLLKHKPDTKIKGAENFGNIFIHLYGAGYRDNSSINKMCKALRKYYA